MEVEPERGDGSRGHFPGSSSSSSGRSGSSFVVFFSSVFLLLLLSFLLAAAAGGRPPWRRRERHPDVEPGRVRRREALGRRRGRLGGAAAVAEEVARVGGEAPRERRWRGTPLLSSLSSSSPSCGRRRHRDAKRREHVHGPVSFLDGLPEQGLDLAEGGGRLRPSCYGGAPAVFAAAGFAGAVVSVAAGGGGGSSGKSSGGESGSGRGLGFPVSVIIAAAAAAAQDPQSALRRPDGGLDEIGERHRRLRRRERRRRVFLAAAAASVSLFLLPALGAHPVRESWFEKKRGRRKREEKVEEKREFRVSFELSSTSPSTSPQPAKKKTAPVPLRHPRQRRA